MIDKNNTLHRKDEADAAVENFVNRVKKFAFNNKISSVSDGKKNDRIKILECLRARLEHKNVDKAAIVIDYIKDAKSAEAHKTVPAFEKLNYDAELVDLYADYTNATWILANFKYNKIVWEIEWAKNYFVYFNNNNNLDPVFIPFDLVKTTNCRKSLVAAYEIELISNVETLAKNVQKVNSKITDILKEIANKKTEVKNTSLISRILSWFCIRCRYIE